MVPNELMRDHPTHPLSTHSLQRFHCNLQMQCLYFTQMCIHDLFDKHNFIPRIKRFPGRTWGKKNNKKTQNIQHQAIHNEQVGAYHYYKIQSFNSLVSNNNGKRSRQITISTLCVLCYLFLGIMTQKENKKTYNKTKEIFVKRNFKNSSVLFDNKNVILAIWFLLKFRILQMPK